MPDELTIDPVPAAQYVRMSTEHQQFSIANQQVAIGQYAVARGYEIVRTYADEGRSGLSLKSRDGLRSLIRDVTSGEVSFKALLVYDVSRWGRFQDIDESAHYEFLCREAGVRVVYCAESFDNDGTPLASIAKGIKRLMAAEYVRDLSKRVYRGQRRIAEMALHPGGARTYGFQRVLLSAAGEPDQVLGDGVRKSLQADRVVLRPGPPHEIKEVRRIFSLYVNKRLAPRLIAARLNQDEIRHRSGHPWSGCSIRAVLQNERYAGVVPWDRRSLSFQTYRRNPPEQWVQAASRYPPIVDPELFQKAQTIIHKRRQLRLDDEVMLDALRKLLREHGYLSCQLVSRAPGVPKIATYFKHFGGITAAFELVGYRARRNYDYVATRPVLNGWRDAVVDQLLKASGGTLLPVEHTQTPGRVVSGLLKIWVGGARCYSMSEPTDLRWEIKLDGARDADLAVIGRANQANDAVRDLFVIPAAHLPKRFNCAEFNQPELDCFRVTSLEPLLRLVASQALPEAT